MSTFQKKHYITPRARLLSVRQKDASETEGESIQNSYQASNAIRGRNVGYNEETGKTD